jgi:hypothetical protein
MVPGCVDAEPIVPEAWVEPAVHDLDDWDLFVEESLALGPPTARPAAATERTAALAAARLTRRGRVALAAAAAVAAAVIVLLSVAGASGDDARLPHPRPPASVLVADGDTLWTIAQRVAPGVDPRREVALLVRLNHLSTVDVVPGQVIRTR